MTVRELKGTKEDLTGENLRVSGAVIGDSITYNSATNELQFVIAHIPGKDDEIQAAGGLSLVLHQAVVDPDNPRLAVVYQGAPPDMLRDEAQAILTGTLDSEGLFLAEELLLKCPSKYEEAVPNQVEN
jgi:cytochrome c-type biogenesis protein CcmE